VTTKAIVVVYSDHATDKDWTEASNNQQCYIPCDKKPRHRENKQMREHTPMQNKHEKGSNIGFRKDPCRATNISQNFVSEEGKS
jgi:hypothetical protein